MCAHLTSFTNFCKNTPAVEAPPQREPVFFISAMSLFKLSKYSSQRGSSQYFSPFLSAVAIRFLTKVSSLPIIPAAFVPKATTQAPVSVARSITSSTPSSQA